MNITNNNNTNFTGFLYGKIGKHITQGVCCCPHGDAKFIKTFNKIAEQNPDKLKFDFEINQTKRILVETTETPELNLFEQIFYLVDKLQRKIIKKKKNGIIKSFIYKINELEYYDIKHDYKFIRQKTLKEFESNVRNLAPPQYKTFVDEFFNYTTKSKH